jgi:hypothetical protein
MGKLLNNNRGGEDPRNKQNYPQKETGPKFRQKPPTRARPPDRKPRDLCDGKARKSGRFCGSLMVGFGSLYKFSANLLPRGKWEEPFLSGGSLPPLLPHLCSLFGGGNSAGESGREGALLLFKTCTHAQRRFGLINLPVFLKKISS